MKVVFFLALFALFGLSAAQMNIDTLRNETRRYLQNLNILDFVKEFSITNLIRNPFSALSMAPKLMQAVIADTKTMMDRTLGFVTKPMEWAFWTAEELAKRNGIHLRVDVPFHFKNTTWNYEYVDYREMGCVSPVKNQGKCGSCYAFGAVAAMESQYLCFNNTDINLSEQQIVDCSVRMYPRNSPAHNSGCSNGLSVYGIQYMSEHLPRTTEEYPYTERQGTCRSNLPGDNQMKFAEVLVDNEDHLAYLLNKNGPVIVYIVVAGRYGGYAGGVFNDPFCTGKVNHAQLVVGLIKKDDQELWVLKNSWGKKWGEEGFIYFPKGMNQCNMISNQVTIARLGGEIITR